MFAFAQFFLDVLGRLLSAEGTDAKLVVSAWWAFQSTGRIPSAEKAAIDVVACLISICEQDIFAVIHDELLDMFRNQKCA